MEYKLTPTCFTPLHISLAQFKRGAKRCFCHIVEAEASPHALALAFSLGTLISLLPTPGLNLALIALLTAVCKRIHKGALVAAMGVWNIFVITPMYVLGHQVGTLLVGDTAVLPPLPFGRFADLGAAFFVGNLIVAVTVTAVSYLTIRLAVSRRRQPLGQEVQA
ncbi:MAG: DUF2062 domain-containing protein [Chloroflexi bacterium]|nr:DUF2062 domain-containing protein [Chloroflexota bacterium]